jgi:hypothetical protein
LLTYTWYAEAGKEVWIVYARLLLFTMESGKQSFEDFINEINMVLKNRKGFKGAIYFTDEKIGENGALFLWESEKDAEKARNVVLSKLTDVLNGAVKGSIWLPLFKVVEPTE